MRKTLILGVILLSSFLSTSLLAEKPAFMKDQLGTTRMQTSKRHIIVDRSGLRLADLFTGISDQKKVDRMAGPLTNIDSQGTSVLKPSIWTNPSTGSVGAHATFSF